MISIFLCLIMSPILMLAGSLIEFSRYQNVMQTTREIVDVSVTSTLSNYDEYLDSRFGLLSVSQDGVDISAVFSEYFTENAALLGNSVSIGTVTAGGAAPLSESDILKQQILDFSETTALTDSLLTDLNLEDLLKKLESFEFVTQILDISEKTADLTSATKDLVSGAEDFIDSINNVKEQIKSAIEAVKTFKDNVAELVEDINQEYTFDYDSENYKLLIYDADGEEVSIEDVYEKYSSEVTEIANSGKTLINELSGAKTSVGSVTTAYSDLKTKLNDASEKLSDFKDSTDSGSSSSESEKTAKNAMSSASDVLEYIVTTIKEAVNKQADTIKTSAIESLKTEISNSIDTIKNSLGISTSGLSASQKQDLLYKLLMRDYQGSLDTILEAVLPGGIETFNSGLADLRSTIKSAISDAEDAFKDSIKSQLSSALQNLLDTVTALFNLNICYDGNLNAVLSDSCISNLVAEDGCNPYSRMLEAMQEFFSAVKDFKEGIASFNFIKALGAMAEVFSAIHTTFVALEEYMTMAAGNIKRLAGYLTGDFASLYSDYLLNAYVVHDIPNRTNYKTATSLSGYDYKDIKYTTNSYQLPSVAGGLVGLSSLYSTISGESGNSDMFCGAELEYILAGTKSEIYNQTVAFMDLYLLRLVLDIIPIFTDEGITTMAAASIVSWAVYLIIILAEPLVDTVLLVNGGDVALIKGKCYLSPLGISDLASELSKIASSNSDVQKFLNNNINSGMNSAISSLTNGASFGNLTGGSSMFDADYATHILLLMMLTSDPNTTLTRLGNIIQLEADKYYQEENGTTFRINKAYTAVNTNVKVTFNAFFDVFSDSGSSVFTKNLKTQRGY